MAADCRPRQMPRPACACGIESRQHYRCLLWQYSARTWGSRLHIRSRGLMRGKYNYGHALASAQWTVSSRRQCRTGWPKAPQLTPATGSGRPHDVRKGIIRRQAAGLARRTRERVGMRLATTSWQGHCSALSEIISRAICEVLAVGSILGDTRLCRMRMARHLGFRERRFPDSAGQTFSTAAMRHNQELSYASSYRSSLR